MTSGLFGTIEVGAVLDRGRVVEQGTHGELLARRSLYWYLGGRQLRG